MVDAAEVVADVGVQHVVAAARAVHAQRFQCLRRAPLRPKPIRRGAEVGLEDGLQHERRGHLRHSVSDRRNAERPLPAIGLRDVSPQDRLRTIRACAQRGAELVAAGARRRTARPRRASRDRRPPRRGSVFTRRHASWRTSRLQIRSIRAWKRRSGDRLAATQSRRCNWRTLSRTDAHRGSWNRACRSCPRACLLDHRDHRRDPSLRSRCSSRASSLLRSPRTPAAHALAFAIGLYEPRCPDPGRADGPLVFRSVSVHACCAPYPAETCDACTSGLRHGRHGLRRDMSGSALGL